MLMGAYTSLRLVAILQNNNNTRFNNTVISGAVALNPPYKEVAPVK